MININVWLQSTSMKTIIFKILILLTLGFSTLVQAAPGPPPPPPPPGLPIDTGLVVLILAAIGLGVIKLKKQTI